MTPERWQQVEEIFQAALDLTPEERTRFVSEACADDTELKRDVESLLSHHDSGASLVDAHHFAAGELTSFEPLGIDDEVDPMIGRRLGAYQIEREVGRGGMGNVYEASRVDMEFRKRAAVKIVKRGMDTDFVLRRFRKERQILAALDHPNIALLLDGGTTEDGLPYFVMEFIEGQPLYRYCDANNLTVAERLNLFLSICEAVHYAHQKHVVHRDIKPSNVLVTLDGVPKLLDFGIAKLLSPDIAGDITHDPTATAMRLMTPEYASPEQVQGTETSPSTDVYSLGVLLYEMLTGHRPYRLRNRAPHEMARVICEEAPVPPSFIITRPDDLLPKSSTGNEENSLQRIYEARRTTLEDLRRDLGGSLDSIVMRALRKEPEARYQSAEQLHDDIARWLKGQPVSVWPDSLSTPSSDKSEPASAENSLAVLPLKLLDLQPRSDSGTDYLGTGLADALITRLSAVRRFAVRPTSSVLRYGANSDPLVAGRELGVAFVLDGRIRRAGDRIRVTVQLLSVRDGTSMWAGQFDEEFTDVLRLEDTISSSVAEAILPHLTGEERLRLAKRGTDNPQAHEAYLRGRYYWNTFTEDGFARAIVCYNQAIAIDPNYSVAYAGVAAYHNWLGSFTVLPFAECAAAAYEAASTAVAIDPKLAEGHAALGQAILFRDFDWANAERQLLRAIEINPNYSVARIWYALQMTMEGRFNEGLQEVQFARSLDPLAIISRFSLIWCSYHARRFNEANLLAQETLKAEPNNLMVLHAASFLMSRLGRHDEAIAAAKRSVATAGKASNTLGRLGSAYAEAGNIDEAEAVLRDMHAIGSYRYISPYHLALVNCALGRTEQALDLLEGAFENRDAKVLWSAVDPELDSLHGHPRFSELLRRLKHPLGALPALPVPSLTGQESVAVLPLRIDRSHPESTGYEYLAFGLTDALIGRLSNVQHLVVRPTSSVLRYRGSSVDPLVAGRDLGVNFILVGRLQSESAGLRVTVELINVPEGLTRWSEQFAEGSTDILTIEDSVSERVATAVLPHLIGVKEQEIAESHAVRGELGTASRRKRLAKRSASPREREGSSATSPVLSPAPQTLDDGNEEARQLYTAGRYYATRRTAEGLWQAIDRLKRAVEIDPEFALAHAELADCYSLLNWYVEPPPENAWALAKESALNAVKADSDLAEAHASLGFVRLHYDRDWEDAERELRTAIQLKPSAQVAHRWYAFSLSAMGRHKEAFAEVERAREISPQSAVLATAVANVLFLAGRYHDAIEQCHRALDLDSGAVAAHTVLRWAYEKTGMHREALAAFEQERVFAGETATTHLKRASVLAAVGRREEALGVLKEVLGRRAKQWVSPYEIAIVYSWLEDFDSSFYWLAQAEREHAVGFTFVRVDPRLEPLRSDPRFESLLRGIDRTIP